LKYIPFMNNRRKFIYQPQFLCVDSLNCWLPQSATKYLHISWNTRRFGGLVVNMLASGTGGLVVSMLASGTGGLVVSMLASGTGGLVVNMLASGTQDRGFEPVGFFGPKNPQHAFLRRGSKAVCPMSQICGMLKNPVIYVEVGIAGHIDRPFLARNSVLH
jgi:hypothetical protein